MLFWSFLITLCKGTVFFRYVQFGICLMQYVHLKYLFLFHAESCGG